MKAKKVLSFVVIGLVFNLFLLHGTALASSKDKKLADKVKAGIAKLGTGKESLVKVTLKDKSKVSGYISEISEDSFTVTDDMNRSVDKIPYSQVQKVKGNNLSRNVKIAIGVVILVAIMVTLIAVSWD